MNPELKHVKDELRDFTYSILINLFLFILLLTTVWVIVLWYLVEWLCDGLKGLWSMVLWIVLAGVVPCSAVNSITVNAGNCNTNVTVTVYANFGGGGTALCNANYSQMPRTCTWSGSGTWQMYYIVQVGGFSQTYDLGMRTVANNDNLNVTAACIPDGSKPVTNFNSTATIVNFDSMARTFNVMSNGVVQGQVTVGAGQSYNYTITGNNPMTASFQMVNEDGSLGAVYAGQNSTNAPMPIPTQQQVPNTPIGPYYGGSTTNINYGAGASTNAAQAIMAGDSALYDAVVKFSAQNHKDLVALIASNHAAVTIEVSNNIVVTNNAVGTNTTDLSSLTNLLGSINQNVTAISNIIGKMSALTNSGAAGSGTWTNSNFATNTAAGLFGSSGFGGAQSAWSDALGGMASPGAGGASTLSINVGDKVIIADLFTGDWFGVWNKMKEIARWLLIVVYCIAVLKDIHQST